MNTSFTSLCTVLSVWTVVVLFFSRFFIHDRQPHQQTLFIILFALWAYLLALMVAVVTLRSQILLTVRREVRADRRRLEARCRRWVRKRSRWIAKLRAKARGHCWLALFPTVTLDVALAIGGFLSFTRKIGKDTQFRTLLRLYGNSSHYGEVSKVTHCGETHLTLGAGTRFVSKTSRCIGVEVQQVIDTAVSTNAAQFGLPKAGELFNKGYGNSIRVTTALTRKQRNRVEALIPHPLLFTDESSTITDHAEIRAFREISRTIFDRLYGLRNTSRRTLCVGAGRYESLYLGNPAIDHYYHMSEGKDYERVTGWILEDLARYISTKARNHARLRKKKGEAMESLDIAGLTNVLHLFKTQGQLPQHFLTELTADSKYEALAFHDSSYNFGAEEWYEIFSKTEAKVAYCYSVMPLELIYPDMPANDLYDLSHDAITGMSTLTYGTGSYSNGYQHLRDKWALPLDRPVINYPDFSIMFEIDARVGPMVVFKAVRVDGPTLQSVVRSHNLPDNLKFVRCMDPFESCKTDGTIEPKYFSVYANEFWETVNYALSLDEKSLSFANLLAFVRRRGGGISLVNKELLQPWQLRQNNYAKFCMCVFLHVRRQQAEVSRVEKFSDFITDDSIARRVYYWAKVYDPINYLRSLFASKYADQLVIFPADTRKQVDYMKVARNPGTPTHRIAVGQTECDATSCDICGAYLEKRGKQVIRCVPGDPKVTIGMSMQDLNKLRMRWNSTDKSAPGLKKVSEEAARALPIADFSKEIEVHYIMGGPGCGKSHFIRAIAKRTDGIALPFVKLVSDYMGLEDEDGKYDLNAKTFHRAVRDLRCCDSLFVDEFTALPWEVIMCIMYLSGATRLYVVGDTKQTRVLKDEGMYMGDYVDMDKLPRHELLRNFRNPADTVALLNRVYDYDMQAMSEKEQSIYIYGPKDGKPRDVGEEITYSHATCAVHNLISDDGKDKTVRTYQGSTVSGHPLTLWVEEADEIHLETEPLNIVALSRHTERLNIVHNGSDAAIDWLTNLGLPTSHPYGDDKELPADRVKHEQSLVKMNADDEEIGKIFQDNKPAVRGRVRRFGINITFSMVLSAIMFLAKVTFGSSFVNRYGWFFYITKILYLNRVFFLHKLTWEQYWKHLPQALAKSYTITKMTQLVLLPLRVGFPWLSLFVQRRRPGYTRAPPEVRLLDTVISRLTGTKPLTQYYEIVTSTYKALLLQALDTMPLVVQDVLHALDGPFKSIAFFCDVIEPYTMQALIFLMFKTRHAAQEDILMRVELPAMDDAGKFVDSVHGSAIGEAYDSFRDWALTYIPSSLRSWQFEKSIAEFMIKLPANVSPKDSYLLATSCLPAWSQVRLGLEYPNILAAAVLPHAMRTGVMAAAEFFRPVNARGNVKAPAAPKRGFGAIAGHKFTANQPLQTLQVLNGRYFNKKPACGADKDPATAHEVLTDIVKTAKLELFDRIPEGWNEDVLDKLADEFFKTAEAKHYAAQFGGDDNPAGREIRFHLKSIFKPAISNQKAMDVHKVGQGISAWNKDAQIEFGLAAKWINYVFLSTLRPHITYDNRMSAVKLRTKLREGWDNVPRTAKNGVTDFAMFDSQQDNFSQSIEKEVLKLLGVSQEFIDHYYSLRKGCTLIAPGLKGRLGEEKPSGEPLTLLGNSIISLMLANWLLRGEGPFIMAVKGDDGFKRQGNMRIDEERIARLSLVCRLKIKAYVEDTAEFCGFAIGANSFCPSIPRKLVKLMGHEFRDYAHFCEYRKSLLDWLSDFTSQDSNDIIATNCHLFEMNHIEVESMVETLRSISHLNEQTWWDSTMWVGDPEVLQDGGTRGKF